MKKRAAIFVLIAITLTAAFSACDKLRYDNIWDALDTQAGIPMHVAKFKYTYRTPEGAEVLSTVEVPSLALDLIDEGIENQLTRINAAKPDWSRFKQISDYRVLLVDPMATNQVTEPGSPAIIVSRFGYPQSQTAGTCLGVMWQPRWNADGSYTLPGTGLDHPYIVVPHQSNQGWHFRDYFMRSVWHESEHIREAMNDWATFQHFQGSNDIHPHFPGVNMSNGIEGFNELMRRVGRLSNRLSREMERPLKASAVYMAGSVRENFAAGGRPQKWQELAESTLKQRRRGSGKGGVKPLIDHGMLRRSITTRTKTTSAEAGTNAVQAKRQHFGYPGGTGRGHSETPARPFVMFQDKDFDVLGGIFAKHVRS
ncbi:MAG: phage virion morphogenesis protein [Acidobacteria bacterium]|nr:phage virion morphogenesis protein [Acidobacteriota bacterium]